MSNEDLELLRFYYEEGIDCTLTESEEEKKVKEEKKVSLYSPLPFRLKPKEKGNNLCFQVIG